MPTLGKRMIRTRPPKLAEATKSGKRYHYRKSRKRNWFKTTMFPGFCTLGIGEDVDPSFSKVDLMVRTFLAIGALRQVQRRNSSSLISWSRSVSPLRYGSWIRQLK